MEDRIGVCDRSGIFLKDVRRAAKLRWTEMFPSFGSFGILLGRVYMVNVGAFITPPFPALDLKRRRVVFFFVKHIYLFKRLY